MDVEIEKGGKTLTFRFMLGRNMQSNNVALHCKVVLHHLYSLQGGDLLHTHNNMYKSICNSDIDHR